MTLELKFSDENPLDPKASSASISILIKELEDEPSSEPEKPASSEGQESSSDAPLEQDEIDPEPQAESTAEQSSKYVPFVWH